MGHRGSRPLYDYSHGRMGHYWQAHRGADAIGPKRVFQWQAIDDLPAEAGVQLENGRYSAWEPYRAALWPGWPSGTTEP